MSVRLSPRAKCTARAFVVCVGVLGALAAVDIYVRRSFVPDVVTPRYEPRGRRLADRTANSNLSILFTAAEERSPQASTLSRSWATLR
jgi:hypothetical protein